MSQQPSVTQREGLTSSYVSLEWDMSVNHKSISLSKNNRMATQKGKCCTIRTPFIKKGSGRYIVNIKVHQLGHIGIGIINKCFVIKSNYLGQSVNSYGTWDNVVAYHNVKEMAVINKIKLTSGNIVTIDLDMNELTFNWAIEGQYLNNNKPMVTGLDDEIAIAASLWNTGDCVEIIQCIKM